MPSAQGHVNVLQVIPILKSGIFDSSSRVLQAGWVIFANFRFPNRVEVFHLLWANADLPYRMAHTSCLQCSASIFPSLIQRGTNVRLGFFYEYSNRRSLPGAPAVDAVGHRLRISDDFHPLRSFTPMGGCVCEGSSSSSVGRRRRGICLPPAFDRPATIQRNRLLLHRLPGIAATVAVRYSVNQKSFSFLESLWLHVIAASTRRQS